MMTSTPINILLVEDDEVDVMNVQRSFKKSNIDYPIFVANNGLEALELLRGENGKPAVPLPRIILLDLNMPKMNGFEFLKIIRNDPVLKASIVYVMTTSNEERDVVDAYKNFVAGYIIKPLNSEKLLETIKALDNSWKFYELPDKLS